ncbi:MAG: MBL fold metallo-hydrolase [Dehalococcoidia bacterium]
MKLKVFRSEKGDCLLLTSRTNRRMLIDGGMSTSYSKHVAPELGALQAAGKKLDLVYVSHIDQDHISGVLQLLDDEAAWRVHEFQLANGNPNHPAPENPRPPQVGGIWHNAFHEQVGKNSGAIESALAASASLLSSADAPELQALGAAQAELTQSIPEAIKVSRRVGDRQLNIPLNKQVGGKLVTVEGVDKAVSLGSTKLEVIGPFGADLTKLRTEWNAWLDSHGAAIAGIEARAQEDEATLGTSELAWPASHFVALGNALGMRSKVTTPNLASIMLLATEGKKRVLLTGDGHCDDIIKGLEKRGALDADGKLHVEVLKVQHHGSENNIDQGFCDAITANQYIFCGNGQHENPDLAVVRLIVERRLAGGDTKPFRFWFNCHHSVAERSEGAAHMKKVETLVEELAASANGRLSAEYLTGSSFEVPV